MTGSGDRDGIDWIDGGPGEVPRARRWGDTYYAAADGLAETRHVFLEGSRLAERWRGAPASFAIGELGFGMGLAFCAVARLRREIGGPDSLAFTSFEIAPARACDMARALAPFGDVRPEAEALLAAWPLPASAPGHRTAEVAGLRLTLVEGDARATVPVWEGWADAWFLDGFAPRVNPEMWEAGLLAACVARTRPGGTLATYSAAGYVRRTLAGLGLDVRRRPGYGSKRECLAATLGEGGTR